MAGDGGVSHRRPPILEGPYVVYGSLMLHVLLSWLALMGGPPCQTIRIQDEGPFLSGTREAYVCWGPEIVVPRFGKRSAV